MADSKSAKGAKSGKSDKAAKTPKAEAPVESAKQAKANRKQAASETVAAGQVAAPPKDYVARLKKLHGEDIVPKLVKEFGYKNALEVPRLDKIVLNMGVGEAVNDTKKVASAAADLALIAGQKPVITRARKAISPFKALEITFIGA